MSQSPPHARRRTWQRTRRSRAAVRAGRRSPRAPDRVIFLRHALVVFAPNASAQRRASSSLLPFCGEPAGGTCEPGLTRSRHRCHERELSVPPLRKTPERSRGVSRTADATDCRWPRAVRAPMRPGRGPYPRDTRTPYLEQPLGGVAFAGNRKRHVQPHAGLRTPGTSTPSRDLGNRANQIIVDRAEVDPAAGIRRRQDA